MTEAKLMARVVETFRENGISISDDTVFAIVQSNTDGIIAEWRTSND